MKYLNIAFFSFMFFTINFASAHTEEYLDSIASPHGGQVRMSGMHHYELVIKPDNSNKSEVWIYVTDHAGSPIDVAGATATVTVLGSKQIKFSLHPAGSNFFQGTGEFKASPDLNVLVSVTLAGQEPEQSGFKPFAVKK